MTTEHSIRYFRTVDPAIADLSCVCGWHERGGLTRHLLDAGRDEGYREGRDEGRQEGYAAAKGEPVDRDDPRIKPGARVRREICDEAVEGVLDEDGEIFVAGLALPLVGAVYLLAEAPDPDAEVLEALRSAVEDWSRDSAADDLGALLVALRAAGWDIVRKDGAR